MIEKSLYRQIQKSPKKAGIYIFKDSKGKPLYIGKAIRLRDRLLYYCKASDLLEPKTVNFLKQAKKLSLIEVESGLEAVLLEINLIRTLKPKYNLRSKDDKRPLLLLITKDEFPRIKLARTEIPGTGDYFGPFSSAKNLRFILKRIRAIFPFCTCSIKRKQPCLYVSLGLCQPSPVELDHSNISLDQYNQNKLIYRKNITQIKLFLRGKIRVVKKQLFNEMNLACSKQDYNYASLIKKQINIIDDILKPSRNINDYLVSPSIETEIKKAQLNSLSHSLNLSQVYRIEGYDIANISGKFASSAMVVFEAGYPNTSQYRRFKIKGLNSPNDPLMIYQTLMRRFKHPDWDYPDLILVDGGITQVRAGLKALKDNNLHIALIGLAKRYQQIIIPNKSDYKTYTPPLDSPYFILLKAIQNEAHRFSTIYHKKLRLKGMLE